MKILLFFGFLLFSGCGSETSEEGVFLTWAVGRDPSGTHEWLVSLFESQNPDIKVRLMEMPESSTAQHDAYVTYLSAQDSTVDVYSLDIIWPGEFASAGWILPLDAYFSKSEQEKFLFGPIQGCHYQDKIYAVPWFTDAGLLYYRRDLLEEAGYEPPQNWQDLVQQASALSNENDMFGYVFQGQQYEGLVCNFLEYLWGNEGQVFDAKGDVVLNSPQAIEALQFMVDVLHKHKISPPGVTTYKEEESRQLFTNGEAIFHRNWPYVWSLAQDLAKGSQVAGKVGVAPIPGKEGGSFATLGGWNLAISAYSHHPKEAWKLVQFLTGAEAQKEFALEGGRLPTRHALYQDEDILVFSPHYAEFYQAFVKARPRPAGPLYPQISDRIQIAVHQALTQKKTPEGALEEAVKEIRRIVSGGDN